MVDMSRDGCWVHDGDSFQLQCKTSTRILPLTRTSIQHVRSSTAPAFVVQFGVVTLKVYFTGCCALVYARSIVSRVFFSQLSTSRSSNTSLLCCFQVFNQRDICQDALVISSYTYYRLSMLNDGISGSQT